jgi:hypothetical protein
MLILRRTQITDAGLKYFKGLPQLRVLNLGDTHVTDMGLVNLSGMPQLPSLSLWKTKVTNAGVADLQKALPNCKIERQE